MAPKIDMDDPTDDREKYDWINHYPPDAQKHICFERGYLIFLFIVSLVFIFATWRGWIYVIGTFTIDQANTLRKYSYYASSGMLGGVVFGMKYFYRVVARGLWHLGRREWRYCF